jgi:hypothetical protein
MVRIMQNSVEIDHAVKGMAGSNPFVGGLPSGFLCF